MPEIPDSKLNILLQIYNSEVGRISWNYTVKVSPKKLFKQHPWYQDLVNLFNIVYHNNLKARDYIHVQVTNYRKATRFSRTVPTIRMMTTPAALEVWEKSQTRITAQAPTYPMLIRISEQYMKDLMTMNNIGSEEDFFKDPLLIREVSRAFLSQHPIFMRLLSEGYYKTHFGLEDSDIL
jgi:hypothetical protein